MRLKKIMAIISCAFMLGTGLPLPARAALIGTEQLLRNDSSERVRISSFLARAEVRRELLARGVDPADLQARVAALSDEEARIWPRTSVSSLPEATGRDVVGALVLVFVILLITDLLGWTKVFPFTRPIHR